MNLPNKLTIFRLILFIPLLILITLFDILVKKTIHSYDIAGRIILSLILLIFIVGMITDFFDGKIARKFNQVTSFGKLWDPIADKLVITTLLLFLSIYGYIPFWITIIFVARDLVVDGSRIIMAQNKIGIEASIWGKLKTFMQTFAIIFVLIIAITYDFSSPKHLFYSAKGQDYLFWLSLYLINIPIIVSLFFSILSGYKYLKTIKPFLNTK
ncbi:CDP-diacylglycerol--glycerol-3-phosphate 3-phosphatidyltransferase [Mycoplasma sp. 1331]|uniref:CDP-diacylglycerol--glycerol-3-phosphate 3-phosphatidyltransferase n=1 Tax=Mycoplasma tauri TaxID=547987 RepID=A0A953T721_9MOLU|nr:CDP-diacylglycerol--glycerol-3-phosphate 3-phosphatidyltransferase [Mycoplasma tauri]MBZ4195182.1 CDP-diacylglycerol--glycerol-3-phosphate 3-phosphatidyltransferase [Mycoplasma tauri]